MRHITAIAVLASVALLAGCGGGERITREDKARISEAALTISFECISDDADIVAVEDAVTILLDARDEFGDQRFALSAELQDVTVQEIIDQQAVVMASEDCAPDQRERLVR